MKPVLIGLQNPYSENPANALAPYPERSAGHRLWNMLAKCDVPISPRARICAADRRAYMNAFERYNLCKTEKEANSLEARRQAARTLIQEKLRPGRVVVLLGNDVLEAFSYNLDKILQPVFIHPQVASGITWRWLPHPSARSIKYNDPAIRMLAGMMLANLVPVQEDSYA